MERIGLAVGLAVASVPLGMRHYFAPVTAGAAMRGGARRRDSNLV